MTAPIQLADDYGDAPTTGERALAVASKPLTWLVVAALLAAGGYAWWYAYGSEEPDESPTGFDEGDFDKGSIDDMAAHIRQALLTVDGCEIKWRHDRASQAELVRYSLFFSQVVERGRAQGFRTVDKITSYACSKILPKCVWPPKALDDIDIDAGLRGELEGPAQNAKWWMAIYYNSNVSLYLAVRQNVAAVIARDPLPASKTEAA